MAASCLPKDVTRRIMSEIKALTDKPVEGIRYYSDEDNSSLSEIHALITGPEDTPYHQGTFHVKLVLGEDYPNSPPKGYFITTIYHPNVHQGTGDICVDTLKKEWNSTNTLETIFTVIRCLLIIPNPDSALNSEAAHKFQYDNENFVKRAKLFTEAHAMPDQNENVAACNPVSSSSTSTKQSATEPAREISAINGNSQSVSGGPSALNSQKMKNSISSGNATGKLSIKVKRL